MCCADMHSSNGTCEVCSTVLYELSMNHMYQNHHTISSNAAPASPVSPKTNALPKTILSTDREERWNTKPLLTTKGNTGAVYQRRAQFRLAMATFQGKPGS